MAPFLNRSGYFVLEIALTLILVGSLRAQELARDVSVVPVQTRFRAPLTDNSTFGGPCQFTGFTPCAYWIRYKTVEIPVSALSVCAVDLDKAAFSKRGRELERKLAEIAANTALAQGAVLPANAVADRSFALLLGFFNSPDALKKQVSDLKSEGKTAILVRDLIEVQLPHRNLAPRYEYRESVVRDLELNPATVCTSTVSTNFLSGPAYRFPEDNRPHLAILVSDDHYHADKTWPLFAEYLEREQGLYTTFLHGEMNGRYRGIDELDVCNALVVFQRREAIPDALAEKLFRLWSNPRQGFLGMRTASHAFETRKEESAGWTTISKDKMVEIIGGNYNNHGPNAPGADVVNVNPHLNVNQPNSKLPSDASARQELAKRLLNEVQPACWHSAGSQYFTVPLAPDSVLLQNAVQGDRTEPLTWVRTPSPGHARIAFTCLGYPSDFNEPACRQMLTNLALWILE